MLVADSLPGLLLSPGFDAVVLAVIERIAEIVTIPGAGRRRLVDKELVHVAIVLQRSDGPLRARAMDVYEQFLDSAVYGAEEAAMASLNR